ncbi:helix-turn-helix domain-containing protein [Citrobacter meridianamericanus]|uniref:helix-turn-helix domain-containing protein n=1 Tax=Citrobacter meridianamericanus TaxID=2894201 RepID=UPI00351D30F2
MNKDEFNCVLKWVEENLCTGETVNSLVRSIGYSRRTIEQEFQANYGISPGEYLFRRRMTRAAVMLRVTSLQISDIASFFHYHSGQNFSRAFRRFSGSTPTTYRKKEVWDTRILQHPLLCEEIISHSKIVNLEFPLGIWGSRKCMESRYDSMNDNNYLTMLRNQMRSQTTNGSQQLLVLCRSTDIGNTYAHRKGVVMVETIVGRLSLPDEKADGIIPSGRYIQYEFNGAWDEFSIFSRTVYLKSLAEKYFLCIGGFNFMEIYSFDNHLHCSLYIPVSTLSEQER